MKKSSVIKLLYLISFLFLVVACKDPLQSPADQSKNKLNDEKVALKIAADFDNATSRSVSASKEDEIAYYESLLFTLKATDSDSNERTLLSDCSYDELLKSAPEIEPQKWTFTLFADDAEKKSTILAAVCEKTITAEDSFVEFQMATVEGVTGFVKIKIIYGSNYISSIDGKNLYPEFSFNVLTTKIVEGKLEEAATPEFECVLEGAKEADGLYSNTYVTEYTVGKWIIQALYNEQIEASEIFYVSPNLTTVAEFKAGRPITFATTPYTENYIIDLPLSQIKGCPEKTLVAGDKLVVTISGYPNKDATLKLGTLIYEIYETSPFWQLVAGVNTKDVELKKDEYFTEKYYYIIDRTSSELENNGIQFLYNPPDLPENLTINNFNIEIGTAEEFDKSVYTYYIGHRLAARIMGEKGEAYTLPGNTGLQDHKLVGWYDNPDFTGEPITEIAAEENTADRTFYAKYEYLFTDVDHKDWYTITLLFDEYNLNPPEPGQIITLKLKGTPSVTVDECAFSTDFVYAATEWTSLVNCYTKYALKANEEVELRFDYLVPEDFDTSLPNLQITVGTDSTSELVLKDWDVSIEINDVTTTFENNGFKAEATNDGILFTITNTDVVPWGINTVQDMENNVQYTNIKRLDVNETISFIYPYVEENKVYTFRMGYFRQFENQTGEAYLWKDVWVKSAGGAGEIDQSAYNKISLSLSDDDSDGIHRYAKIEGFDSEAMLELQKKYPDAHMNLTVWAGEDWSNHCGGYDIHFNNDGNFWKITTEGKLDVVELAELGNKLSVLNEKGKYWAELSLILNDSVLIEEENDYSHLQLAPIQTEKTTFVPVEKSDSSVDEQWPVQAKILTPVATTSSGKNLTFTDEFLNLSSQSSNVTLEWTLNVGGTSENMDAFATEEYSWFYKVNGKPVNIEGKNIITINTPSDSGYITISVEVTNSNNEKIYYGSFTYLAYN
ncbi:MAG: hypothetical protein MJ188_11005 [Treponema sp.]|nr:hypothetical protein [Treponema sp.]